ncbi:MAG: aspartyl/asparaginyl beta-hydroxylase domain-containing protein [Microthrixaceae bacterium]
MVMISRTGVAGTQATVLGDPGLDRVLARDGFVVVPLVGPDHAARLRSELEALRPLEGSGFRSDLIDDDTTYRRAANQLLAGELDPVVAGRVTGLEPFLHSFLVKHPGGDSDLYLHRDWMYVDERLGHRTYVVWVALEDITGHNGQLRVLRGSHRLDPMLRGTDLVAPWLAHTEVIEPRLLSVPVPAGHCVVFDNQLVHSSFPNHTDRPRVAAAVGLRPVGAPLVHFRRRDARTAERFEVDEEFFLRHTPQGLLAEPPALPVAEVVDLHSMDLSPGELAARLDVGTLAKIDRVQHAVTHARRRAGREARHALDRVRSALPSSGPDDQAGTPADASPGPPPGRLAALLRPGAAGLTRPDAPAADAPLRERLRAQLDDLPTKAAIAVLGLNEASIRRFGPDTPAVWDPAGFDWARRIEAGYPEIRAEVDALLDGPVEIPHIEDVTGGIPQGNIGPWRSFVLMHQGRWMDWNCDRCPRTTALVRSIPGLTMAGFSVLEPGTHITEHRGPNKGALRYQLGVVVPGDYGDCRIRVGEDMLVWQEGEGVMFDFTVPHEAWNDSDGIRVLLMLEVITPGLPWYLRHTNAAAQRAMGWFPTTRDMTARLRRLEPTLTRPAPDEGAGRDPGTGN